MKKLVIALTIMTLSFFTFVTCNQTKQENMQKVRIGEVTHSLFYAPLYVALQNGYFKDEGLDIDLQTTAGGDKTMTALLSNGIDIALVGSETSI